MKRGAFGDAVKLLNNDLSNRYGILIQNKDTFGWRTELLVKTFQEANVLLRDGIVGDKTKAALESVKVGGAVVEKLKCMEDVKYLSQRDNKFNPTGTCNVTALAMLLQYVCDSMPPAMAGYSTLQLEDALFQMLQQKDAQDYYKATFPQFSSQSINVNTVHGMLDWLAREKFGVTLKFSADTIPNEIMDSLDRDRPVILSGMFTGSGHIVLAVGYARLKMSNGRLRNVLIVHDPWGDWERGYSKEYAGDFRVYFDPWYVLKGNGSAGYWTHLISGV